MAIVLEFNFNISPSNEHPGLTSLQSKGLSRVFSNTILLHSTFFVVQLSHPYMTTGRTIAFTRWTYVDKVMSLLFNMLSRLVITFLPRSKRLLISWLQSPSAVIFAAQLEGWSPNMTVYPQSGVKKTSHCKVRKFTQIYMPTYLFFWGIFSLKDYPKILNLVPYAVHQFLLILYFIYGTMYQLILDS